MLTVVLNNGFEFEVDSINEINSGDRRNASEVVIRCALKTGAGSEAIRDNITGENLSRFGVLLDGEKIDEYIGFSDIRSVNKVITKFERSLTVQAAKESK